MSHVSREGHLPGLVPEAVTTELAISESVGSAILHSPAVLQNEQLTDNTPLAGMRSWMTAYDGRPARGKVSLGSTGAELQLKNIHQAYKQVDTDNALPDYAPNRFLANFTRYLDATGAPYPQLDHRFLVSVYGSYVEDVQVLHAHGVSKASDVALYHGKEMLFAMQQAYEGHPFVGVSDINKAFLMSRRNPMGVLKSLENKVQHIKETVEPKLRATYGYAGSWSLAFIKNLCEATDPEGAAKKVFAAMSALYDKYPNANPKNVETWAKEKVIDGGQKARRVEELLKDVPNLACSEQDLHNASADVQRLRMARLSGRIRPMPVAKSAMVQRFVRFLEVNWHEDFTELDVAAEVSRLYFAAKDYNTSLEPSEQHLQVSLEPDSLYGMLRVFAANVARLREEGPPGRAANVARFYGPGVYAHFIEKYKDEPLLTAGLVTTIVSRWPLTADEHIRRQIRRVQDLKEVFGDQMSMYSLSRFAEYEDGADRIRACQEYSREVLAERTWVKPSDVARFFFSSSTPETDFEAWADKVETLQELAPRKLGVFVRKRIAQHEGTAQEVFDRYAARKAEILETYKGHPYVSKDFAATWAANAPQGYLEVAAAFLKRTDEVSKLLDQNGQEVDYIALRQIAFSGNDVHKRVEKYLSLRQALRNRFQEGDHIEQWMLNQAAAFSNTIKFAGAKVVTLSHMKQSGVFDAEYYDERLDARRSPDDLMRERAWHSIPENVVVYMEDYQRRQAQVEQYLSNLNELDRLAVETVFGFIPSSNKSAIEEELGIDDLETYVNQQVIPQLQDSQQDTA